MSIYKSSSLAMIPSAYKDGKLYSVRPVEQLGSELVTNGDFSSASDWTFSGGGVAISGGKLNFTATTREATQSISVVNTKTYRVSYEVSNYSAGSVRAEIGSSVGISRTANGIYSEYIVASGTNVIQIDAVSVFTGSIDNVSVKEVLVANGDFDFSRGTTATRVASSGYIEKGRENLLLQSNQFDTTWINYNTTETSGQSGYDGTNDAWLIEKTGASGSIYQTKSISGVNTFSVYAKKGTRDWVRLTFLGTTNAYFDLANGVVGTRNGALAIDSSITSVGGGWYRISFVSNNTSTTGVSIIPAEGDGAISGTSGNIYIQDAQVEAGLVATDYIETGASTAQSGILEDMPRLDYSGGATCPSLLLEPQRTNLFAQSEYYSGSYWSRTLVSFTDNYAVSPEGKQNATRFLSSGGAYPQFGKSISGLAIGQTYTASFYVKSDGTSQIQQTSWFTGFAGTTFTPTDEWQRISFNITATATTHSFVLFTNNPSAPSSSFLLYGLQLEAGSYPTSYIPTYGSSVTRSGDSTETATPSTSLFNQTEGVIYAEWENVSNGNSRLFNLKGGGHQIYIKQFGTSSERIFGVVYNGSGNVFSASTPNNYLTIGDTYKVALRYKEGEYAFYVNGTQIATSTATGLGSMAADKIDLENNDNAGSCKHKQAIYFPTALTDTELASLTTL